jgi:two-component system, NtrC family, response regulator AtoC
MTILIIEESLLIGGRIRNLLAETGNIDTIYQSVEHKKAAAFFDNIKPQVVLLDMCLPGSITIELLQQIKDSPQQTAVVALVNCEDYRKQLKCMTIGADYILDKYHEFEKIPQIVDRIVSKQNLKTSNEKPGHYSAFA